MKRWMSGSFFLVMGVLGAAAAIGFYRPASTVTFLPYIQPGDNGKFGKSDQMLVVWQTDETSPSNGSYAVHFGETLAYGSVVTPVGRVVDNYLSVDATLSALSIPTAYGTHTDYCAVLKGLEYNTMYFYKVTGPGMPGGGFLGSFHTRKRGDDFCFQVQGDEGFFPGINNSKVIEKWNARIIHTMYHAQALSFPDTPAFPRADLALNTGDNVYTVGAESNYRDFWMPVWNSDTDSNDDGAPFIRHIPLYIVVGNHDVGATGATANMLADNPPTVPGFSGPGRYGGGLGGGDALAHFNNFYFPLNGPMGADIQSVFTGDASTLTGLFFTYLGTPYNSSAAIEAYRASTAVDAGRGTKRQIDHMSNYSFDYGNAHFVFLDANPHNFGGFLPPGNGYDTPPSFPFTPYPKVLREWLINDLDSSNQTWKMVVFHQPTYSSGNATIRNDQMRLTAKFLEDHGVNMVFNGHEHNYQRTYPIRTLPGAILPPGSASPAVEIDPVYDGDDHTVPDGVLYLVEGGGGDRDFDGALANPRGQGPGIDQDDSATGSALVKYVFMGNPTSSLFPNGPASWLDTSLTNSAMTPFIPGAGSGPKITVKFKSKLFSFAHTVVRGNKLTLYQVSEPLSGNFSGTFGTDLNGTAVNDPLPDTLVDPATGLNTTSAGDGTSVLLDKIVVTKPELKHHLSVHLDGPHHLHPGDPVKYTVTVDNDSAYSLNGSQIILKLPRGVSFTSSSLGSVTLVGRDPVITLGRLLSGGAAVVEIMGKWNGHGADDGVLKTVAVLRSGTALPVESNEVKTHVPDHDEGGK
jgi:uncharacterized repeat protein (TIGR01451 family)